MAHERQWKARLPSKAPEMCFSGRRTVRSCVPRRRGRCETQKFRTLYLRVYGLFRITGDYPGSVQQLMKNLPEPFCADWDRCSWH
ncbi:UNVERIFIED_CONTAM: hypothetical protein PYX00_003277 [Menopon gallinae]|uniref:Transposase n=1 Tax=Menopon gallinae TaxID=328185 RepID=A0AAW2HZR5_9NEOP